MSEEHTSVFERADWDKLMAAPPPPMRYVEGHEAYRAGKPEDDNPYAKGTEEFDWWATGWADAQGLDSYWMNIPIEDL